MTYTIHVVHEAHPIKNTLYHVDQFLGFAGSLCVLKVTSNSGGDGVMSILYRKEQGTALSSFAAGDNTRRAVFLFFSAEYYLFFFGRRHKAVFTSLGKELSSSLKCFMQNLHSRHIEKEPPRVRREIMALVTEIEGSLTNLGDKRQTPVDIRMFLTRLSMKFHSLTQAASNGNYQRTDGDFSAGSSEGSSTRLRADIHCLSRFSTYMRGKGHLRKLCSDSEPDVGSESDIDSEEEGETLRVAKQEVEA
ncbi:hypothetical protein V496_01158 [Pseudogymnoascus sp. VKM F-4515 (FW-2607)]|nr:hypothetical protein V496_01158 [Pseudogymnoascus sp. VKM F-4515 (FW-2607)]KFY98041.1 hypothetical protein V498_01721 [Pseudogymnoascus sp. VKM F-4517 (FW-2822)]